MVGAAAPLTPTIRGVDDVYDLYRRGMSLLEDGQSFATVELKINFLKPVWEGTLTAVGEVLKAGRTLTLCECRVTDAGGSLVAFATSTCMTIEPRVN